MNFWRLNDCEWYKILIGIKFPEIFGHIVRKRNTFTKINVNQWKTSANVTDHYWHMAHHFVAVLVYNWSWRGDCFLFRKQIYMRPQHTFTLFRGIHKDWVVCARTNCTNAWVLLVFSEQNEDKYWLIHGFRATLFTIETRSLLILSVILRIISISDTDMRFPNLPQYIFP